MNARFFSALMSLALLLPTAQASDLAKEQRWADQTVDALIDGEAEELHAGDIQFLAIYTEADEPSARAALVLHGIGAHPDWPQVVYPLRTGLPSHGWSTLSLQMPVLANEARYEEYAPLFEEVAPRIEAGIAFLKQKGAKRIVLVAHSLGATMATYYLAREPREIAVLVGVGMTGGTADPRMDIAVSLAKVRIPVLDIYGQYDESVLGTSAERAKAAAANPSYTQIKVPQASHFFEGQEQELLEIIVDWLNRTVPSSPQ
jgi:pimeloyl-ACP methyl ester carboxylesterase